MRKLALSLGVAAFGLMMLANVAFAEGGTGTASDRVNVQGSDIVSGGQGVWVKIWAQELADRWQRTYGWSVPQTINIYLYSSGSAMTDALAGFMGRSLTAAETNEVSANRGVFATSDMRAGGPGGYAILVNVNSKQFGTSIGVGNWMNEVKGAIVRQMAELMINDVSGSGGPTWMRIGYINYLALAEVGYLNEVPVRRASLTRLLDTAAAPGLVSLHNDWNGVVTRSGESSNAAFAIATITVQQLVQKYGPMALFNMMRQTSQGGNFESIFQQTTGSTIQQMDQSFRSSI